MNELQLQPCLFVQQLVLLGCEEPELIDGRQWHVPEAVAECVLVDGDRTPVVDLLPVPSSRSRSAGPPKWRGLWVLGGYHVFPSDSDPLHLLYFGEGGRDPLFYVTPPSGLLVCSPGGEPPVPL